jgi:hypothetical protein
MLTYFEDWKDTLVGCTKPAGRLNIACVPPVDSPFGTNVMILQYLIFKCYETSENA